MSTSSAIAWILTFAVAYVGAPVALVCGWMEWMAQRQKVWTVPATLSFIGFMFGSVSGVLALLTIGFAVLGGFGDGNALFYRVVKTGFILSLTGILFALGGIRRRTALRWFAPSCAIGTCAFWLVATTWP